MDRATRTIVTVGAAVGATALVAIAVELQLLRTFLQTKKIKVLVFEPYGTSEFGGSLLTSPAGYAIWIYRQGHWRLEADLSAPGHEAMQPSIAGSFEGQIVKKESSMRVSL